MAYRLEDGEGMASGIRRIVREEVERTIDQLEGRGDSDPHAAIHDARKRLKKARSALRLVRDDLGNGGRREENAIMRDAARSLSGARDAQVLLETLDVVAAEPSGPAPREAVRPLRTELERRRRRAAREVRDDGVTKEAAAEALTGVLGRVHGWPLEDEGFGAARAGLERIHGRGRRAMAEALERGDDDSWHEWRKRVKDLWYCVRILRPVAPAPIGGIVSDADALSEILGDHNDVAVLDAAVEEHREAMDLGRPELLQAAVARRRARLRLAAVPLGRRLYAEKSRAFARRLSAYWDARAEEEAAHAHWLTPEAATRVRQLLADRASADARERRRMSTELRRLGFRVTDFAEHVPRRRGGLSAEDLDDLIARGVVRIGEPSPTAAP
jgi:CHAD domain-containing protein